jgi:hypothetical protein
MTRSFFTVATIALTLVVAGCGDSRESLAEEGVSTMKELVATLDGVKDASTAKAAKSKIQSLVSKLDDLKARMDKLGANPSEEKALQDKYGKEMEEQMGKLLPAMMRIQFDPNIQGELKDIDFKK